MGSSRAGSKVTSGGGCDRGTGWRHIVFLTALFVLFIHFTGSVEARDTSSMTPVQLLEDELTTMVEETLPGSTDASARNQSRDLADYRTNLENLRSILGKSLDSERRYEEAFDAFEDVLDSYSSLVEELRERRVEDLEDLVDRLEDQRERIRDQEVVPQPRWLAEYDRSMVPPTSLEEHHRVLVRSFGLVAAGFLSGDPSYRLETYLDSMERVFPEVTRELLESDGPPLHNLRYYDSLLTLVEGNLSRRSSPGSSRVDRYLGQLRRQGDLVLRISRTRSQRAPVEALIERVDTILRTRSGREAGLLERTR